MNDQFNAICNCTFGKFSRMTRIRSFWIILAIIQLMSFGEAQRDMVKKGLIFFCFPLQEGGGDISFGCLYKNMFF